MRSARRALRKLTRKLCGRAPFGQSVFADMREFLPHDVRPLILDVGANVGQSVKRFRNTFPSSVIHSFEPSPEVFKTLLRNTSGRRGNFSWNCAMGAAHGKRVLFESRNCGLNSFLPLDEKHWGSVAEESLVDVTTIDRFLDENRIEHVHILKSDTQGYDLEVLKGAEQAIRHNRIDLIHIELIFSAMYESLPPFYELFRHLLDRDFFLVSIYGFQYQRKLADWAEALFVNKEFYANRSTISGPFPKDPL